MKCLSYGKDLNFFLNWLNFWIEEEVTVVNNPGMAIDIAEKNHDINYWLPTNKEITFVNEKVYKTQFNTHERLNIQWRSGILTKYIHVYNEQKQLYNTEKLTENTGDMTIDFPKGTYYFVFSGHREEEQCFSVFRSNFTTEQTLRVEKAALIPEVYVNNQYSETLTKIYRQNAWWPGRIVTEADVANVLIKEWARFRGKIPELDELFGTVYPTRSGFSYNQQEVKSIGTQPLTAGKGYQYIGRGYYRSGNNIFTLENPKRRNAFALDPSMVVTWTTVLAGTAAMATVAGAAIVAALPYIIAGILIVGVGLVITNTVMSSAGVGSLTLDGVGYHVDNDTGIVTNTETGKTISDKIISGDTLASAAGAMTAVTVALSSVAERAEKNNNKKHIWYTYEDLLEDHTCGGETIRWHIGQSKESLSYNYRTSFHSVFDALYAINLAKIMNPSAFNFPNASDLVQTFVGKDIGYGYSSDGIYTKKGLASVQVILEAFRGKHKSFRVVKSHPIGLPLSGGNEVKQTKGYDVTPIRSSYEERINQTPKNHGEWTGERGESMFKSDKLIVKEYLDEAGIEGIEYKNGMPDFSPVSKGEVKVNPMTTVRKSNYKLADEQLAKQLSRAGKQWSSKEIKNWREYHQYTWHEFNDGTTMQLIPTDVNSVFIHLGGVSEVK